MVKIIVGLGNPGEKYKLTRHNAGFMIIDALAAKLGLSWENNKKLNAQTIKYKDIILVKPSTFMNNSGQSAQSALSYYKLWAKKLGVFKPKESDLSKILTVIHDDLDIELGKYKISSDSRSAGHNGVQSIINHLKTKNFKRIRIGIRTETAKTIPADKFVLQKFNEEELRIINNLTANINEEVLA